MLPGRRYALAPRTPPVEGGYCSIFIPPHCSVSARGSECPHQCSVFGSSDKVGDGIREALCCLREWRGVVLRIRPATAEDLKSEEATPAKRQRPATS